MRCRRGPPLSLGHRRCKFRCPQSCAMMHIIHIACCTNVALQLDRHARVHVFRWKALATSANGSLWASRGNNIEFKVGRHPANVRKRRPCLCDRACNGCIVHGQLEINCCDCFRDGVGPIQRSLVTGGSRRSLERSHAVQLKLHPTQIVYTPCWTLKKCARRILGRATSPK